VKPSDDGDRRRPDDQLQLGDLRQQERGNGKPVTVGIGLVGGDASN
jgi:hypothetical protein